MLEDRNIRTVRNNVGWCDVVCSAHGNPGEFYEDIWLNRQPAPPFYPNAETLSEPSQRQLDLIDELVATNLPSGWAVKDSFCLLDLASRGFQVLFEAEWIYLPVSRLKAIAPEANEMRWKVVRSSRTLAKWESAWSRASSNRSEDRIFLPSLLHNKNVTVVAGYHDGRIVSGAIANRSEDVVGWSNFFSPETETLDCASASLAKIADIFPSLPIVGYEHCDQLHNAGSLGFESIGPLRVWTFTTSPLRRAVRRRR
jgi:hypothetical protein